MEYYNVYQKRLNRFGLDYQARIQGEREKLFDLYLLKTLYRVEIAYNDSIIVGSFEKYQQDDTRTVHSLLTKMDVIIPYGTILQIPNTNKDGTLEPWMVYYLDQIEASGYNKYIMLRMTHYITFTGRDNIVHNTWAYMYGKKNSNLVDTLQNSGAGYLEDQNSNYFIMPKNEFLKKEIYFEVGEEPYKQQFVVTGYDIQSSEGVEYVTVDPRYEYDLTPAPEKKSTDSDEDFYWFNQ